MNDNENNVAEENEDVDLQKSLDNSLEQMNDLLKSKKTLSKDDVQEMMKNPKNKDLFKEYMKGDEGDEEEEEDEEEEKMKKSFDDIYDEHNEVIDAVPVLKSFSKVLENLTKKITAIGGTVENLQKSFEDNYELQKSFGSVIADQSELIKSINDEVETIANAPLPMKGKVKQKDLFKSTLDDGGQSVSKLVGANRAAVKEVLIKSMEEKTIPSMKVSKWELGGYDLSVFSKSELAHIESKLN